MSYINRSYGSRGYRSRGRRGDGIAKIEGFIIFVSGAKTGDHVKFKITRVARRFATAEIVH